jgi:hypothetical protein
MIHFTTALSIMITHIMDMDIIPACIQEVIGEVFILHFILRIIPISVTGVIFPEHIMVGIQKVVLVMAEGKDKVLILLNGTAVCLLQHPQGEIVISPRVLPPMEPDGQLLQPLQILRLTQGGQFLQLQAEIRD